jgi:hypothetical protein
MNIKELIRTKGYSGALLELVNELDELEGESAKLRETENRIYARKTETLLFMDDVFDCIKEVDPEKISAGRGRDEAVRFEHDSTLFTVTRNPSYDRESPWMRITFERLPLLND